MKQLAQESVRHDRTPIARIAVIRNIAREAGVHIYTSNDDFVAANNWLPLNTIRVYGIKLQRLQWEHLKSADADGDFEPE